MIDERPIQNEKTYITNMQKSMIDKLFFLDKIDVKNIIDYGCADATMLKTIYRLFPEIKLSGYDINPKMLVEAKKDAPETMLLSENWNDIIKNHQDEKTAVTLSSIIHEVYSYGTEEDVEMFWDRIWNNNFKYVVIRDMMVSKTASRPSDTLLEARIRQVSNPEKLQEWESQWGSISENWSLVHYLLTYRYEDNWDREMKENYLPVPLEKFLSMIPNKYTPIFFEHTTLPFLRQTIEKDFGVQLQERTHIKIILKLND